jgi:1-acyl-sn-glycerol-3-phosphate acyltransferase
MGKIIRVLCAIIMMTLILLCMASTVLVLSPIALIQRIGWQSPIPFFCGWGFYLLRLVVTQGILGVKITYRDNEEQPQKSNDREVAIIIANHPTPVPILFATPSLMWNLGWRGCVGVVKSEFIKKWYLVWLGVPATLAGFALPIQRENRTHAVATLAAGVRRLPFGKRPFGIIIFPDGTRPTPAKIAQSWKKYTQSSGNPLQFTPFTHVLVPKARGLHTLITELQQHGHNLRVIDLTIGYNRELPSGLWQCLVTLCDVTLIVNRTDITEMVRHTALEELTVILLTRWAQKDAQLKEWARTSAP